MNISRRTRDRAGVSTGSTRCWLFIEPQLPSTWARCNWFIAWQSHFWPRDLRRRWQRNARTDNCSAIDTKRNGTFSVMSAGLWFGLLSPALVLAGVMASAWLAAVRYRNGGLADIFWTFGVGAAGVLAALWPWHEALTGRQILVAFLVSLWSLRLGTHILKRSRGAPEDARYADLRRQWGDRYAQHLFAFLQIQAVAAWPLVAGIAIAAARPGSFPDAADAVGIAIFAAGLAGGTVADRQLAACKRDPAMKGRVCDTGLWAWSRHPNYFFEWVVWCSWPAIAIGPALAFWPGALALLAPLTMYWLLVHVSGIPPLEEHMERSRGEAFRAYQRRTPAFFPRPP